MNREQLEQKLLICQELGTKAAFRGLCHVTFKFSPRNECFSCVVYHVDSTFEGSGPVIDLTLFRDFIVRDSKFYERNLFELDSTIAFFQGLLDTGRPMLELERQEEAA